MSDIITAGSTSRSIFVGLDDASSSTGAGLSGIVAANLNVHYLRMETDNDGTVTAVSMSDLAAITTAYTSGGWKEMDVSNGGGTYRLDLPDGALAVGAWEVVIVILDAGSNNIAPVRKRIQLDPVPAAVQSLVSGSVTAAVIADGAIDAATFAASAITATAIASDAITAAKIADGAIDANTFAASAITATAIASNAITAAKIVSTAISDPCQTAIDAKLTTIVTAVWAKTIGGTTTAGQIMRYVWAYVMGKITGANTASPVYYHPEDGTTAVITGNGVTSTGNRNTSTAG